MSKIKEQEVTTGAVAFHVGRDHYRADYVFPAPSRPGLVKDEGRWKLSKAVYQRTSRGRPVKRPRAQQLARYKQIGIFDSLWECRVQVVKEVGSDRLCQAIEVGMIQIAGRGHARILSPPKVDDVPDDDWLFIMVAASEMIRELEGLGFEQIDA